MIECVGGIDREKRKREIERETWSIEKSIQKYVMSTQNKLEIEKRESNR